MDEYNDYLKFAKEIANYAGKTMIKYFNQDNGQKYKGDKTVVTLADTEINSYLVKKVKEKYPTHAVDGEEEQFGKSNYLWVCDPVDGTAMYARHIPTAVFSLALVVDGESVLGVVYDPFTDSLYTGVKGQGAYCNNKKISVNNYKLNDKESVIHIDTWPTADYQLMDVYKELGKQTYMVNIGSIVRSCICVAKGDFTLAVFPGTKHRNCDIAAVKIIVEEAGGKVTDIFGEDQRYDQDINGAIVSNSIIHDEVVREIKKQLIQNNK